MDKWTSKFAVVTGASSGIGLSIVKKLLINKIKVISLDLKQPQITLENFFHINCNTSDLISIKEAFKVIEEKFTKINILVNCAGVLRLGSILDSSDDTTVNINQQIATNFTGYVHCAREAVRLMRKSNDFSLIINICSNLAFAIPYPNFASIYPATKYAVRALSEIIRQDLVIEKNDKIRVTNLSPGYVETNLMNDSGFKNLDGYNKVNPKLHPDDVAEGVLYVLSTNFSVNVSELTIKPLMAKF